MLELALILAVDENRRYINSASPGSPVVPHRARRRLLPERVRGHRVKDAPHGNGQ
jgi:hypothetical protein